MYSHHQGATAGA